MSDAAELLADLNDELACSGETIILTRVIAGGASLKVCCAAFVRRNIPQESPRAGVASEITGPFSMPDMRVILSPTELIDAGFPLTDGMPIPVRSDSVMVQGKSRTIQVVTPIVVGESLVRIEMSVRG